MKRVKSRVLYSLPLVGALLLAGCFATGEDRSVESVRTGDARLVLSMGVNDVGNLAKPALGKAAATTPAPAGIKLKYLIVTLTSSVAADSVISDTIVASDAPGSKFRTDASVEQVVLKQYSIKPLRDWTIKVETRDEKDSLVHEFVSEEEDITIGESRLVEMNLAARFVVYAARFVLPDSIGSSSSSVKQKLYVDSLMMIVTTVSGGDTLRDTVLFSTAPGYFTAAPDTHVVAWNYVPRTSVNPQVELYVFGDSLGNWDTQMPIFGDTIVITNIDSTYAPSLPWMGPGSEHDPNGQGGGAVADLKITLGPVDVVTIRPSIPGTPLARRKD